MQIRVLRASSILSLFAILCGVVAADFLVAASPLLAAESSSSAKSSKATSPKKSTGSRSASKSTTAKPTKKSATRSKATSTRAGSASKTTSKSGTATTGKSTLKKVTPRKNSAALKSTKSTGSLKQGTRSRAGINGTSRRTARSKSSTSIRRKGGRRAPVVPAIFDPTNPGSLRAEAAVVIDTRTMQVVWSKNPHAQRPVASLTKLMTALVVLEHRVDLSDSMTVTKADITGAGRSHVRVGNRVSVGDLFRCALISSDNAATRVLARSTGLEMADFVRAMNDKARALGLEETHYADPTGLSPDNRSTAADQARLIILAADQPLISQITSTPSYTFVCGRRIETLTNTNRLLRSRSDIVGGKTGFINSAGYCLAMLIGDREKPYLTTVVLGAPSNSSRFAESAKLINWALGVVAPANAVASPRTGGSSIQAGELPAVYQPPIRH